MIKNTKCQLNKITECQKELLFNSRMCVDLSKPQQYCLDYENVPKKIKYCCKYTGKTIHQQIPDQMVDEDLINISKNKDNSKRGIPIIYVNLFSSSLSLPVSLVK